MRHTLPIVVVLCFLVATTNAAFVAYNDCAWQTGQFLAPNATAITGTGSGDGSTSGTLKDITTGSSTGVSVTLSWKSVSWNLGQANSVNAGTDARIAFDGTTVDINGVGAYKTSGTPSWAQVTFTGLDPSKEYEFTTTANRSGTGSDYASRTTKFLISDADSFNNMSSSGVTIADAGASTTFVTGNNVATGYVARWTGIRSGTDGDFTVWSGDATFGVVKPYVVQVFKLAEVPEPATLSLLALGGLALLRRRR